MNVPTSHSSWEVSLGDGPGLPYKPREGGERDEIFLKSFFFFSPLVWKSQRRKQEAVDFVADDYSSPVTPTGAEQWIRIPCAPPATPDLSLNFSQTLFAMKMQESGMNEH